MLENTVIEHLSINNNLSKAVAGYCPDPYKFKIKPGHRNYIMNLMQEIDRTDVDDFFSYKPGEIKKKNQIPPNMAVYKICRQPAITDCSDSSEIQIKHEDDETFFCYENNDDRVEAITEAIENEESSMESEEMQYVCEEYLSCDENQIITEEMNMAKVSQTSHKHRKPDVMYNKEFLAKNINPRKRRLTDGKTYPNTDEGNTERFRDLVKQSLECILPKQKYSRISHKELHVYKEADTIWRVECPLCPAKIRLCIIYEKNGKYCNFKRSNFERHLRFKHCLD